MALRVVHAIAFEAGPGWLEMSLLDALILDIGLLLFFLPYIFLFNISPTKNCARRG